MAAIWYHSLLLLVNLHHANCFYFTWLRPFLIASRLFLFKHRLLSPHMQKLQDGQCRLFNGVDKHLKYVVELSTFSNSIHEAICYSQESLTKIWVIFSMISCPGREFWWWGLAYTFMASRSITYRIKFK